MSADNEGKIEINTRGGWIARKIEINTRGGWIALAMLIIYFGGDPDLHDLVVALINNLPRM